MKLGCSYGYKKKRKTVLNKRAQVVSMFLRKNIKTVLNNAEQNNKKVKLNIFFSSNLHKVNQIMNKTGNWKSYKSAFRRFNHPASEYDTSVGFVSAQQVFTSRYTKFRKAPYWPIFSLLHV